MSSLSARCRNFTGRNCPGGKWTRDCRCIPKATKSGPKRKTGRSVKRSPKKQTIRRKKAPETTEVEREVTLSELDLLMKKAVRLESLAEAKANAARKLLEDSEARANLARERLEAAKEKKHRADHEFREAMKIKEQHIMNIIEKKRRNLDAEEKNLKTVVEAATEAVQQAVQEVPVEKIIQKREKSSVDVDYDELQNMYDELYGGKK